MKESIIDEALAGETGKQIKEYTEDEDLTNLIKFNPDDSNFYLSMNLTQPPFDDIHVRKAMNFVMDKTGLIRAWGGPLVGEPATHTLVPSLAPPELDGYDPYPSPDFAGDPAAAMEEMKQSKYDTDQDGICDAPECKGIINIMGTTARDKGMVPVIEASAAKIGIEFKTRLVDDPYSLIFVPKEKIPFTGTRRLGEGLPGRVHVLPVPVRRAQHHARVQLQRAARRADREAGAGDRRSTTRPTACRASTRASTSASRSRTRRSA